MVSGDEVVACVDDRQIFAVNLRKELSCIMYFAWYKKNCRNWGHWVGTL